MTRKLSRQWRVIVTPCFLAIHSSASATAAKIFGANLNPNDIIASIKESSSTASYCSLRVSQCTKSTDVD